jgi:hypothetical protein
MSRTRIISPISTDNLTSTCISTAISGIAARTSRIGPCSCASTVPGKNAIRSARVNRDLSASLPQSSVARTSTAGVPGIGAGSKGGPIRLSPGAWPLDRPQTSHTPSTGIRMARSHALPVGAVHGGRAFADRDRRMGPAHCLDGGGKDAALGQRSGQMGHEVCRGARHRGPQMAVAKGDGRGKGPALGRCHLGILRTRHQCHVGGLQVDGGHHHCHLVARGGHEQVELLGHAGRSLPQPAFLRQEAQGPPRS